MWEKHKGEMHAIPSGPESFVELPREGGVAYAAQESWIQNETIKVCVLFGFILAVAYSIAGLSEGEHSVWGSL